MNFLISATWGVSFCCGLFYKKSASYRPGFMWRFIVSFKGSFNNYVDKKRGGRGHVTKGSWYVEFSMFVHPRGEGVKIG